MNIRYLVLVLTLMVVEANAGNSTLDAAIGGGIGGAAGAAIGHELGDRDGAILGGALGGAAGAAINTDKESHRHSPPVGVRYGHAPRSAGYPSYDGRDDRKEYIKHEQELAREERKHHEEMKREARKHREEMWRERRKAQN